MDYWNNNLLQFARLICECEAAGAFDGDSLEAICKSMDLEIEDVMSLIERAQKVWDGRYTI